ncbi:TIGR02588 family protein [Almyronema epifaneia]|uniref:TIGR02588 family protein n=1 Tax=Almyronema epifaneia S1 TaxID=2991925 RepID=A0ABW6IHZ9_9CYAN
MTQNNSATAAETVAPDLDADQSTLLSEPPRTLAEWITLAVTSLILAILVGLVVYDWRVNQNRPPAFQVEITETARITDGRYYVPFAITNTGGRVARTVQVTAALHLEGIDDEAGEQQIDFLSGNERKRGSFVFNHDPQAGELLIRVASYRLP